jgi:hypothetical protein
VLEQKRVSVPSLNYLCLKGDLVPGTGTAIGGALSISIYNTFYRSDADVFLTRFFFMAYIPGFTDLFWESLNGKYLRGYITYVPREILCRHSAHVGTIPDLFVLKNYKRGRGTQGFFVELLQVIFSEAESIIFMYQVSQ